MCATVFLWTVRRQLCGVSSSFSLGMGSQNQPECIRPVHKQFYLLSHFPSPILVYMLLLYFYILSYMCYHMYNVVHAGRSKDNLQQSVLPFYHVGPRNQIQLSGLAASPSTQSGMSLVPVPVFNRWVAMIVAFSFVV